MSKPGSALSSFAIFGTIPNPENRLQPWQLKALNPVGFSLKSGAPWTQLVFG
jgi:hypothetical protein